MLKSYPITQSRLYGLSSKKRLASLLGFDLTALRDLVKQPDNYSVYTILQGNGKPRKIEEPKPEMKRLHSRLGELLSRIVPPPYLHSGTKGRSYVTNATAHIGRGRVIKADLSKFYPSTTYHHVFVGFLREFKCSGDVARLLADICTYGGHVPTGSPASMLVAFYSHKQIFDQLHRRMEAKGFTLTVYVDDLTISGRQLNGSHLCPVKRSFQSVGLKCHKVRSYGPHESSVVTGAVVTNDGLRLPRRRHQNIGDSLRRLREASSYEEIQAISRKLLGQINEAASVDERSRRKLPGLRGLISRIAERAPGGPSAMERSTRPTSSQAHTTPFQASPPSALLRR
jgi:hypothetical protein